MEMAFANERGSPLRIDLTRSLKEISNFKFQIANEKFGCFVIFNFSFEI